jgi:hypothetical protein
MRKQHRTKITCISEPFKKRQKKPSWCGETTDQNLRAAKWKKLRPTCFEHCLIVKNIDELYTQPEFFSSFLFSSLTAS